MSTPDLFQLLPEHDRGQAPLTDPELAGLYAYPEAPQRFVRANMVATIDGAATGINGLSGGINNAADYRVFRILRALAQVVVVGAQTARAEGYRNIAAPSEHAGLRAASDITKPLEFAIVTRSGIVPGHTLAHGDDVPAPIVLTTAAGRNRLLADHPHARCVVADRDGSVDLAEAISHLAALGLTRVLCEGGPSLLAQMIDQGLVDEVCLTTVGLLQPGAHPGITSHTGLTPSAHEATLGSLLVSDSTLIAKWLVP